MRLFTSIKNLFQEKPRFPSIMTEWHSAGILFTADGAVLVGYKRINDIWTITGFGGKREEGETYYETAIREILEEFYEIPITREVVNYVANQLHIRKVHNNNGYILIVCDIKELKAFIITSLHFILETPLYDKIPHSIVELVGSRKEQSFSEFPYIGLLPINLILSKTSPVIVDNYLVSDLELIRDEL